MSRCRHENWESVDGLTHCLDCLTTIEVEIHDADDEGAARAFAEWSRRYGKASPPQITWDDIKAAWGEALGQGHEPVVRFKPYGYGRGIPEVLDDTSTPIYVQMLREQGWVHCFLHLRPEPFDQWVQEGLPTWSDVSEAALLSTKDPG